MLYKVGVLVGQNLVRFGGAVAKVFSSAWDLLDRFYARILRPFVQWSWSNIVKLHDWLKTTLGPVLKFLDAVRRDIETIYTKWLRPILDTIDAVRATLKLLADFHVPFAQAIDEKLAALEARLVAPIRLALAAVNDVIGWIDRIVTFDGLFQRLTMIQSLWAYSGDAWNVLLKHQPAGVSIADNARRRALTVTPLDAATLSRQIGDYATSGAGELQPAIDVNVAMWRASASAG